MTTKYLKLLALFAVVLLCAGVALADSIDFVEGQKIPATLKADRTHSGANTFSGAVTVSGNAEFTGTTTISGATACTDIQTFAGEVHLNGSVTELGNAAGDAITVTGTATFAEDVGLTKDLTVTGNDINLGSTTTGVKITSDGDGAITFLGASTGNDESLTWNYDDGTANTVTVSTATSVGTVDWSAIGHTTTGTVKAGLLLSTPAAAQTIGAGGIIAATDSCGGFKEITASAPVTTDTTHSITAPAAGNTGCCITLYNSSANTITIDTNTTVVAAGAANLAVTQLDVVTFCSNGTSWFQTSALLSLN